ncbi:MAG: ABC transporter substrate-binding protein [Anaerolineae bacterium]|nr:ABC transporter substrate-binding protein [Anaerolineae bacterium]
MLDYTQNEFVHLVANPNYYATGPKVDEVIFQTFSQADILPQALITGQVDMITEIQGTAVSTLRDAENVAVVTGAPLFLESTYISFNQIAPEDCPEGTTCSGHPALQDRTVRLALAHATDKQKIIDVTMLGLASPGLTLLPRGLAPWFNDSLQDFSYDVSLANQMLDDAGYLDVDNDGIREMPGGGLPLTFRTYGPNDMTVVPRMGDLIAEMWLEVGVKIEFQIFDPDSLWALCCPDHDFDILIWGWSSDPDPKTILSVMVSTEIESGNNDTGYVNPLYDELFAQQAISIDTEKRKEIIWQMQQIVFEDVVFLVPFYPNAVQAYRTDRFTGWVTDENRISLEDISSLLLIEPVK